MNIIEAIKSGKPHRRRHWSTQAHSQVWRAPVDLKTEWGKSYFYETLSDLLADDWEIQEPTVTITRTQFWKAVDQARTLFWPTPAAHVLADKLGLED